MIKKLVIAIVVLINLFFVVTNLLQIIGMVIPQKGFCEGYLHLGLTLDIFSTECQHWSFSEDMPMATLELKSIVAVFFSINLVLFLNSVVKRKKSSFWKVLFYITSAISAAAVVVS